VSKRISKGPAAAVASSAAGRARRAKGFMGAMERGGERYTGDGPGDSSKSPGFRPGLRAARCRFPFASLLAKDRQQEMDRACLASRLAGESGRSLPQSLGGLRQIGLDDGAWRGDGRASR
jgi:hypothetical protein